MVKNRQDTQPAHRAFLLTGFDSKNLNLLSALPSLPRKPVTMPLSPTQGDILTAADHNSLKNGQAMSGKESLMKEKSHLLPEFQTGYPAMNLLHFSSSSCPIPNLSGEPYLNSRPHRPEYLIENRNDETKHLPTKDKLNGTQINNNHKPRCLDSQDQ